MKHTVAVVCATKCLHHLDTGCCLPKTTFRTKIGGGAWLKEHPKIWDPLRIFATVEATNFKFGTHNLGLGLSYQKQLFGPKLAGVWAKTVKFWPKTH